MNKLVFDIQRFASDSAALSVIKKFMKSLDNTTLSGTAAVDEAVKACSDFSSAQEVINQLISDRQNSSSTSDFLLNYCGINLNNSDTGAITGSDAGGSVTKTATSVVPESGSSSYPSSTTFTKRGLTVTVPAKSTLTSTQQVIVQGLYSWWIEEALKLVEESYGYSFTDSDASVTNMNIEFIDDSSGSLASTSYAYYPSTGRSTQLKLIINSAYFSDLTTSNVDGLSNYAYLDRTIAHELTHAVMAAKINYCYNLPDFLSEGLGELVQGADDTRNYEINSLAANTSSLKSALALSDTSYNYHSSTAGYIFLRYLAKQAANDTIDGVTISNSNSNTIINGTSYDDSIYNYYGDSVSIDAGAGDDSIDNYYSQNVTINAGADNDYIYNSGSGLNVKIDAGAGNDSIFNIGDNVTINAGAGNDSIFNYGKNVTINAGAGNDTVFLYSYSSLNVIQYASGDGNDIIYSIKSTDTLQITGAKYTTTKSGDDLIVGVGSGKITLVGAANTAINIDGTLDGGGNDTTPPDTTPADTLPAGWKFSNTLASATLTSADDLDLTEEYGAKIKNVNASITSGGVQIIGNSLNNSIRAGKGADLIAGGAGNDTVSLGAGADTYIYSSGNDLIQDYKAGEDVIKFETAIQSASVNSSNLIIKTAKGNVTVKSAKDKSVTVVDSNDETLTIVNEYPVEEITTPAGWKFTNTLASATLTSADDLDLTEEYGAAITKVDASKITGGVVIYGNSKNNSIKGSKGADEISGGTGNDTVSLGAGADTYIYSSGNDLIQDYKAGEDVIKFETPIQSASLSSSNLIIKTAKGNVTVKSAKDKSVTVVDSNDETLTILNEYPVEEITTPAGWKFANTLASATLTTADDLDLTEDYGAAITKVDASKITGGVVIYGNSKNNSIKGSKGADEISGDSGNDTVSLGAGADTYIYSSGNDLIQDYAAVDAIQIDTVNVEITSIETVSSNVIIETSEGKISVKSGANKEITLIDANGDTIDFGGGEDELYIEGNAKADDLTNELDGATINALAGNDNIENIANEVSINAGAGNDNIYNTGDYVIIEGDAGRDKITNEGYYNTIIGGAGNDTIENDGGEENIYQYASGDGNDFIYGFGETDTLQITKGNYSYSVSGNDFVVKVGSGTIKLIDAAKKIIHINDEEISPEENLPDGWKFGTASKTSTDTKIITATIKSAEEIDLTEGYGNGVEKVDGSKTSGVVIFGNDLDNSIKGGTGNNTLGGGAGNDILIGNTGADIFVYSEGDDRIINYVGGSGKDSIQIDIDNISKNTTSKIQREIDGEDIIYYIDGGTLTIQNGKDEKIKLMDSNGVELILTTPPKGWKLDSAKNLLQATVASADNEIDLTEDYGEGVIKVDASKITGGVEIYGNDLNNSIKTGKGNDILDGGAGNDTLTSGAGDDLFIYNGGDDYITDYTAGKDSIQVDINEIEIYSMETVGANVVYATDAGNITVKSGKGKEITLIDADGEEIIIGGGKIPNGWKFDSTKNLLQATVAGADNYIDLSEDYGDGVEKVDGSKISGVEIYGNDLDNSIKGGKGNDILDGGACNDTLTGGAGADTYCYTGGDDVITDYATVDAIQFDTENISITNRATVGSNVVFTTDAGTLTVKNAKTKKITLLDSDGEEFSYTKSSKNVAENIWFLDDDNNFENCAIDSVTENKFAVTDIQNYNSDTFAQDDNILTFAKDK